MTTTYQSITVPEELENYFSGLDSYDQPYFLLVSSNAGEDTVNAAIQESVKQLPEDEIHHGGSLTIKEGLIFVALETENDFIQLFVSKVTESLNKQGENVFISVFRHNCLGEGAETFKWCTQLLDEVLENQQGDSAVLYNDFTDRENWPGLSKYNSQ